MKTFLTCEWRKLAMANYVIDPALLTKYLPAGTELDLRNDKCFVSLVGFMFLNTKVQGFKIPFHINFEEVNLRFYVKTKEDDETKRGVVFIREIVPRPALSYIANLLYAEKYVTLPMTHNWIQYPGSLEIEYKWKSKTWNSFLVKSQKTPVAISGESEEEFILEHYWGYTKVNETKTFEYRVDHPTWQVYPVTDYSIDVNFGELYGREFEFLKKQKPESVFLAEGSDVSVRNKRTLKVLALEV
jgi:uncharacterized protein